MDRIAALAKPTQSLSRLIKIGQAVVRITGIQATAREAAMRIGADGKPIEVLLIEDSPGDVRLTTEAFREANRAVQLHVAFDGVEAMAFLRQEEPFTHVPRPDLILLDLNLPKMDGREVLKFIKQDPSLKLIPTVILTTSAAEADITKSYELRANSYLTKPVELDAFDSLVTSINDYWLTRVEMSEPHPTQPTVSDASRDDLIQG